VSPLYNSVKRCSKCRGRSIIPKKFAEEKSHINRIENFWNQANRNMRRYNGLPKTTSIHFSKSVNGVSIIAQQAIS